MEGFAEDEEDDGPTKIPTAKACTFFKRRKQNKDFLRSSTVSSKVEKKSTQASENAETRVIPHFESSNAISVQNDQRATAGAGVDAPKTEDHRAILERNAELGQAILEGKIERGIYRGQGAYAPVAKTREGAIAAGKYTGLYGPVRGVDNVRMTMRVDYDPCICKDYKETGYCGFGDSCKFLHDRTDYKGGWQIEKEYEESQKKKQMKLDKILKRKYGAIEEENEKEKTSSDESSSDDDDDALPFACLSCKTKWNSESNPVVTVCGHYFCESCAMANHSKSPRCAQCGKNTNGIFNVAPKINEKIDLMGPEKSVPSAAATDSDNEDSHLTEAQT